MSAQGTATVFRDENFLEKFGLCIGNVLDYFSCSNFYDTTSLNELAKQRHETDLENLIAHQDGISFRIALAQPAGATTYEGDDLKKEELMTVSVIPGLVVIDKQLKDGVDRSVIAKYYILDGSIYQAPDVYSLLSAKIRGAMFHIRESLHEVKNMFDWNLETGFRKKVAADETETLYVFESSELEELKEELGDEFKLQNDLLNSLLSEIGIP